MTRARLEVGNATSHLEGLRPSVFRSLRFELSYQAGEPGERVYQQDDGSVKRVYWDGFTSLLQKSGNMPSGLVPRTLRVLQKWGVAVQVVDVRERLEPGMPRWSLPDGFQLRPYQVESVDRALEMTRGVIDSPPRTGKTVIMADLIRQVARPTVVTAPTRPIAEQTLAKLLELFHHDQGWSNGADVPADFYLLQGGPPKTRKAKLAVKRALVFVGTADTAVAMPQKFWDRIECLIVDERHHQAALKTYGRINKLARNAFWRWGFTGTNFRSMQGEQVALEACLGRIVSSYTITDMRAAGVIVPARVHIYPVVTDRGAGTGQKFAAAYARAIVRHKGRNQLVVAAALQLMAQGRRVLVLVNRIEHGDLLRKAIRGSVFVQGADGPMVREAAKDLHTGALRCVIGSPVVGEGLDMPGADALVYAKGLKARVTHTQDVFRVLTAEGDKRDAVIVDFADRHHVDCLNHSVERLHNYVAMGATVSIDNPDRLLQCESASALNQEAQLRFNTT